MVNNNIQNQNPVTPNPSNQEGILSNFQQKQQEEDRIDAMLTELGQLSFDQLVTKYTLNKLLNLILTPGELTYYSVIDQFVTNRQILVTHFIKSEAMPNISEKTKDKILSLLAALKAEENPTNITTWLLQIDPNLILPADFQVANFQPRAYELWLASENIKKIIVETTYNEYLGDVLKLTTLPEDRYQILSEKVKNLAHEIADTYKPPQSEQPTPQPLIDKTLAVFTDFGRTPMFIAEVKEKNIFGNMVEIFSKIEFSVTIAEAIRAKNLPQPLSNETIINETKIFMTKNTILK